MPSTPPDKVDAVLVVLPHVLWAALGQRQSPARSRPHYSLRWNPKIADTLQEQVNEWLRVVECGRWQGFLLFQP